MKFVHLADLHLDRPFTSLKNNRDLIKRRRIEQKFIFKKAIDLVKDEKAEMLFISGDLFENKYVEKDTINYIISSLKEIKDTKVYIAPGNHDPLIKASPYNTYEWPENVFIFSSEVGMDSVGDINIYGLGFNDFEMESTAIKDIKVDKEKINILVTHGTLDGASGKYHDIKTEWLEKFDYVALGHIHLPKLDGKIIYSGSLVACGFDEPGEHGLVVGEITKENLKTEFIKMDSIQFETKEIDITNFTSPQAVLDKLDLKDNYYKIILTGIRNINVDSLTETIMLSTNNVCEIEDKTKLDYDFEEISRQKTLKGICTKKMLEDLKSHPEEEAKIMKAIEYLYNNI